MNTANARRHVTSSEFLAHPAAEWPSELVRGEVHAMTPAGGAHGVVAGTVFAALNAFVAAQQLGLCFPDGTGFLLPGLGDTVRSPDAAFLRADKLPRHGFDSGWIAAAPDLVVEILSPSETAADLEGKLRDYAAAGTQLIWVVDPALRVVAVKAANAPERRLSEPDTLEGDAVLPGFAIPVARLFAGVAR